MVEENDNTSYRTEDEQGMENIQEMNNIEVEYEQRYGVQNGRDHLKPGKPRNDTVSHAQGTKGFWRSRN